MSSLRWGRVVRVHPEDHSVDLVMTDDLSRLAGVQVLTPTGGTNFGFNDLVEPAKPASGDEWDLRETTERDILAAVAFFDRHPVVIGFRYPQICQMLFDELNRRVNRHASDVYSTVDGQGNMEVYHPSGTFLRVATSPAHEDLTGRDFDRRWAISKNTDKQVHLQVTVANAGGVRASINIDPAGNVTVNHTGNLAIQTAGNASISAGGTMDITSGGNMRLTAPRIDLN